MTNEPSEQNCLCRRDSDLPITVFYNLANEARSSGTHWEFHLLLVVLFLSKKQLRVKMFLEITQSLYLEMHGLFKLEENYCSKEVPLDKKN